jgi:hypothetical protein
MKYIDLDHLKKNKISYLSHFKRAIWLSSNMILGGALCFVHAFIPFIFVEAGSSKIKSLYWKLIMIGTKKGYKHG